MELHESIQLNEGSMVDSAAVGLTVCNSTGTGAAGCTDNAFGTPSVPPTPKPGTAESDYMKVTQDQEVNEVLGSTPRKMEGYKWIQTTRQGIVTGCMAQGNFFAVLYEGTDIRAAFTDSEYNLFLTIMSGDVEEVVDADGIPCLKISFALWRKRHGDTNSARSRIAVLDAIDGLTNKIFGIRREGIWSFKERILIGVATDDNGKIKYTTGKNGSVLVQLHPHYAQRRLKKFILIPEEITKLNVSCIEMFRKMLIHATLNRGKSDERRLKVSTLLSSSFFPTDKEIMQQDIARWGRYIRVPFEQAMNEIQATGKIRWEYEGGTPGRTYTAFLNTIIIFDILDVVCLPPKPIILTPDKTKP